MPGRLDWLPLRFLDDFILARRLHARRHGLNEIARWRASIEEPVAVERRFSPESSSIELAWCARETVAESEIRTAVRTRIHPPRLDVYIRKEPDRDARRGPLPSPGKTVQKALDRSGRD